MFRRFNFAEMATSGVQLDLRNSKNSQDDFCGGARALDLSKFWGSGGARLLRRLVRGGRRDEH